MLPFLQREAQEREEAEQVRQERIKKEQEEEREVRFASNFTSLVSTTQFIWQVQRMIERKAENDLK